MADGRLPQLTAIPDLAAGDLFFVVDVSNTTVIGAPDGAPRNVRFDALTAALYAAMGLQAALDGKQDAGSYAPASHTHSFGSLTGTPTTLAGYGITDGGMAIGGTVTGGTAGRLLAVGAGPVLAELPNLTHDGSTLTATTTNGGRGLAVAFNGQGFGFGVGTGRGAYSMEVFNPGGICGGWTNGGLVIGAQVTNELPPTNGLHLQGGLRCHPLGDAQATNNLLYFSSDVSKLSYKDASGNIKRIAFE